MINWPAEMLELVALQQEKERASQGHNPASMFSPQASEADLVASEQALRVRFDAQHRQFLSHSDGWNGFSSSADLFSTADFLGSPRFKTALQWIKVMDRRVLGPYARQRAALLPIGKSQASSDLLLMVMGSGQVGPRVVWTANELIEDFDSFEQMFASFKGYASESIAFWKKRLSEG